MSPKLAEMENKREKFGFLQFAKIQSLTVLKLYKACTKQMLSRDTNLITLRKRILYTFLRRY